MIWTHNFKFLKFSPNFSLKNGKATGLPGISYFFHSHLVSILIFRLAITIGPGVQWAEAYAFAAENNVVIAGGIAPEGSVGAGGGWPLGGGHNILSPSLGLGTSAPDIRTVLLILKSPLFRRRQCS